MTEERLTGRRAAHVDAIRQGRYVSTQRWGYVVPLFVGSVAELPPGRTPTETPGQLAARLERGQVIQASIHSGSHYFRGRGSPMASPTIYLWLDGDTLVVSDVAPVAMQEEGLRLASGTREVPSAEVFSIIAKTKTDLLPALQAAQEELIIMAALADAVNGISAGRSWIKSQEFRSVFDSLEVIRTQLGGANWHELGPLPKSDALLRVISRNYIDLPDLRLGK